MAAITITDGESTWSATLPPRILAELRRLATATSADLDSAGAVTPAHIAATLLDVAVAHMQANDQGDQITPSA
ncbi:MAG: hypothetical protein RLZZ387_3302 [Chloroflexota bacterium]